MPKFFSIIVFSALVLSFLAGCSTDKSTPAMPDIASNESSNSMLFGIWNATFDLENNRVIVDADRSSMGHFKLTSFLPAPEITINNVDLQEQTVSVSVKITNNTSLTANDLRLIIYTDDVGHKLLNDDSWTALYDIPGGMPINPFIAYNKYGYFMRPFYGQTSSTEGLTIRLPGMNPNVKFAIEASYPTFCDEPYQIPFCEQGVLYDQMNSQTQLQVIIWDWLDYTYRAYFYCPWITGTSWVELYPYDVSDWRNTIVNARGVPAGRYPAYVMAFSNRSSTVAIYDEVFINVSPSESPAHPQILTTLGTSDPQTVAVQDNFAYLADGSSGLKIIDITDPGNPHVEGSLNTGYSMVDVAVHGNYAMTADSHFYCSIDITDKTSPFVANTFNSGGIPKGVVMRGDYAYLADYTNGMYILDITDGSNMQYKSHFASSENTYAVDALGNIAVMADCGAGIQIIDVSNKTAPVYLSGVNTSGCSKNVTISGDLAFISDDYQTLIVLDISNPAAPSIQNFFSTGSGPNATDVQGNYAYVAEGLSGMRIFDITEPTDIRFFSLLNILQEFKDIDVQNNYAYIPVSASGLMVVKLW